jgi:hypothetical protein
MLCGTLPCGERCPVYMQHCVLVLSGCLLCALGWVLCAVVHLGLCGTLAL